MRLMQTSWKGLEDIKEFEGLRLKAYKCAAGVWTIGYGHTKGVTEDMEIGRDTADVLLSWDVAPIEKLLNGMKVNFRQGQFDALVSFIFNLGEGAFNKSLKGLIQKGASDEEITAKMQAYCKARVNGVLTELPGLVRRRKREAQRWME